MAELTFIEESFLEDFLEMNGGYVLDFSNRSFKDFFASTLNINIEDAIYYEQGDSKAKRMRCFLKLATDNDVALVLESLRDYKIQQKSKIAANFDPFLSVGLNQEEQLTQESLNTINNIITRLKDSNLVENIDAIQPIDNSITAEKLAETIKTHIENNQPDIAIDRLHTYTTSFLRRLCVKHQISVNKDLPLQSLLGQYIKHIEKQNGEMSEMTKSILKMSISIIDRFNKIRNDHSLAHDNEILNYNESLFIFNNITNLITFINNFEDQISSESLVQEFSLQQ